MPRGKCAWCGSADIEVELDLVFCLSCGEHSDLNGNRVPSEPKFLAPNFQERKRAGEVQ